MKSKNKTKDFVLFAFFIAIELVLMLTPLGYIPIGLIRATTLHIPVIICAIFLGYKASIGLGLVFGLTSLFVNTFYPTPTSFIFSPFIKIGGVSGNFASLLIVLVPRIILGISAKFFYDLINKITNNDTISIIISSIVATFIHTFLVLSGIYIFFKETYSMLKNIPYDNLLKVMVGIVASNGIMEMIIASILSVSIIKALKLNIKRGS